MPILTIPGHYDGHGVTLDESVALPKDTPVLVTVLPSPGEGLDSFQRLSSAALAASYDEDEVEYTANDIKEK